MFVPSRSCYDRYAHGAEPGATDGPIVGNVGASKSGRAIVTMLALELALALDGSGYARAATNRIERDPPLLAALRADPDLRRCACIVDAVWIDLSYPRITVERARWRKLSPLERRRSSARALAIAEAVFLREFAAVDQYEEIFFVDRRGRRLDRYAPA